MQSYQSSRPNPDFNPLHDALPEGVVETPQKVALEVPQLGRPARLVGGDDEDPGSQ